MPNELQSRLDSLAEGNARRRRSARLVAALAVVIAIATVYAISLPAFTLGQTTYCGQAEHTHTDDCYDEVLVCTDASEGHSHTGDCYERVLSCGQQEHAHTDACYADPDSTGQAVLAAAEDDPILTTDADPVDLTSYITSSKFERAEGNDWVEITDSTFTVGDEVRITLSFNDLSVDSLREANGVATYTFPAGLTLPHGSITRDIVEGDKVIGSVTYENVTDEDGITHVVATLTYNQDFLDSASTVKGDFNVVADVSKSGVDDSGKIDFGGDGGTVTIKDKDDDAQTHDISTDKTSSATGATIPAGASEADIPYTVTVSTTKGTDGTVTVADRFASETTSGISYSYKGTPTVTKVAADGTTRTAIASSAYTYTLAEDGQSFRVSGLPALAAGESYEVSYTAHASGIPTNGDGYSIQNIGSGESGNNSSEDRNTIVSQHIVSKGGSYDSASGAVNWTITVNPDKRTVDPSKPWVVSDTIENLSSDIVVYDSNNQVVATIRRSDVKDGKFTYNYSGSDTYTIRYSTKADGESGRVTNTVSVDPGNGQSTSDTGVVEWHPRDDSADKGATGHGKDDIDLEKGTISERYYSNGFITGTSQEAVTITDVFGNASFGVEGDGDASFVDQGIGSQYAEVAALWEDLVNNTKFILDEDSYLDFFATGSEFGLSNESVSGGALASAITLHTKGDSGTSDSTDEYVLTVEFRDTDGEWSTWTAEQIAANPTAHVTGFRLTLSRADGKSFSAYRYFIHAYRTTVDISDLEMGSTVRYKNKVTNGTASKETEVSYKRPTVVDFSKQVKTGYADNGLSAFTSGDQSVSYEDGFLTYRLLFTVTGLSGDISISDLLPLNTTLVTDGDYAPKAYFLDADPRRDAYDRTDGFDWVGSTKWDYYLSEQLSYSTSQSASGNQVVNFVIADGYQHAPNEDKFQAIAIEYTIDLRSDPRWDDNDGKAELVLEYLNSATWGDHSSTTTTDVTRRYTYVDKEAEQGTGEHSDLVYYNVVINDGGQNLNPNSDFVTLTDTMDADGDTVSLDLSSVRLYYYDAAAENHRGAEVNASYYTLRYDESTNTMTLDVPDETALVLSYTYRMGQSGKVKPTLTNTATLAGEWKSSSKTELLGQDGGATSTSGAITLHKVDSDNYRVGLAGVVFDVEYYDTASGTWKVWKSGLSTGEGGTISFDLVGSNSITAGTLYRAVEKSLGTDGEGHSLNDGYVMSSTPTYFMYAGEGVTEATAYASLPEDITSDTSANHVAQSSIFFSTQKGGSFYVPNDFEHLQVNKVWLDEAGNTVDAPEGASVTVQLSQLKQTSGGVSVTVVAQGNTGQDYAVGTTIGVRPGGSVHLLLGQKWNNSGTVYISTDATFDAGDTQAATWSWGNEVYNGDESGLNVYAQIPSDWDASQPLYLILVSNSYNKQVVTVVSYDAAESVSNYVPVDIEGVESRVTLSNDNDWTYTWDGLPKTDGNGERISYAVTEVSGPEGYDVTYVGNGTNDGTITIINHAKSASLSVQKSWEAADGSTLTEGLPSSVSFQVYQVASPTGFDSVPTSGGTLYKTYSVSASSGWKLTVDDLPHSGIENGEAVTYGYYVVEVTPAGFLSTVDSATTDGYDTSIQVTNTKVETTEIRVRKVWQGEDGTTMESGMPASVTYQIYQVSSSEPFTTSPTTGGTRYATTQDLRLSADNDWTQTVSGLPKSSANADGSVTYYAYYVVEDQVDGFEATYSFDGGTAVITNRKVKTTSITVRKAWLQNGVDVTSGQTGSISLDVYRVATREEPTDSGRTVSQAEVLALGGELVREDVLLSPSNNWEEKVENLAATNGESGDDLRYYAYYVVEDNSANYDVSYANGDGIAGGTVTITNDVTEYTNELPMTGGPGTGLFYVTGGLMSMVALAFLARRMRSNS